MTFAIDMFDTVYVLRRVDAAIFRKEVRRARMHEIHALTVVSVEKKCPLGAIVEESL
jgi:hypothetical protein